MSPSSTMLRAWCAFGACLLALPHTAVRAQLVPVACTTSTIAGFDFEVEVMFGFVLRWALSPDLETVSFQAMIDAELPGWVSVGFSSDGQMIGSDAVVAFPSQSSIVEYDLNGKVSTFNQPSPLQEITDGVVEVSGGTTSVFFTRPTAPLGDGKLALLTGSGTGALATMIWAFGPSEVFAFHYEQGRGAISIDLFCSEVDDSERIGGDPVVSTSSSVTMAPSQTPNDLLSSASPTVTVALEALQPDVSGASASMGTAVFGGWGGWTGSVAGMASWSLVTVGFVAAALR